LAGPGFKPFWPTPCSSLLLSKPALLFALSFVQLVPGAIRNAPSLERDPPRNVRLYVNPKGGFGVSSADVRSLFLSYPSTCLLTVSGTRVWEFHLLFNTQVLLHSIFVRRPNGLPFGGFFSGVTGPFAHSASCRSVLRDRAFCVPHKSESGKKLPRRCANFS